jgi:hypothetical protein
VKLKIDEIEPDWEMELLDLEEAYKEMKEEILNRYFWGRNEWNRIVQKRESLASRIRAVKKKLSEGVVE